MISFSRISKQYGRQILFVDASFQLNPGEKVGLVGPNGSGKTTLFRMIVGEESPDEGDVSVPKKTTVGYFRQDVEEMSGRSVLDEAKSCTDWDSTRNGSTATSARCPAAGRCAWRWPGCCSAGPTSC
jgi:ATPase subunit of ABC transporter with duplicated ATPase domains